MYFIIYDSEYELKYQKIDTYKELLEIKKELNETNTKYIIFSNMTYFENNILPQVKNAKANDS